MKSLARLCKAQGEKCSLNLIFLTSPKALQKGTQMYTYLSGTGKKFSKSTPLVFGALPSLRLESWGGQGIAKQLGAFTLPSLRRVGRQVAPGSSSAPSLPHSQHQLRGRGSGAVSVTAVSKELFPRLCTYRGRKAGSGRQGEAPEGFISAARRWRRGGGGARRRRPTPGARRRAPRTWACTAPPPGMAKVASGSCRKHRNRTPNVYEPARGGN